MLVLHSWNNISHPGTAGTGPPGTSLRLFQVPLRQFRMKKMLEQAEGALAVHLSLAGQLPAEACKCLQGNRAGLSLNFMAHPPWKRHLTHIYHWDFRSHCFPSPQDNCSEPSFCKACLGLEIHLKKNSGEVQAVPKNCLQALAILFSWWVEREEYSPDLESLSKEIQAFVSTGAVPLEFLWKSPCR